MSARKNPNEALALGNGPSIQPIEPGSAFAVEADRVDRLSADSELVSRLMWAQYEGPEWRLFRTALAQYGVAVLCKWIQSGRVFSECAKKGFGSLRRRRHHDPDDVRGIAGETVARAFLFFRDRVLIPGVWDPSKGASVRTYFIGACLLHFPNEYKRSLGAERVRVSLDEFDSDTMKSKASHFSRPDVRAEIISDFQAIKSEQTQRMVLLKAQGYPEEEIATAVGTSRKAVESRLYHLHERKT